MSMPPTNRDEPALVVTKAYDLVLWLLPKAETFPRSYRFSVGERVVAHGLDLLLALVEAAYTANKASLPPATGQYQGERAALPAAPGQGPAPPHRGFLRFRRGAPGRDRAHGGRLAEVGGEAIVKRVGGLWPELVSFPNLLLAARRAAAGKRTRPDVAAFLLDLEPRLVKLQRDLRDGSYAPGPYRCFSIRDPKPRLISAAPFRDRVVHHALTQVLEPVFEKRFSKDSFACRKDLGMHRALARAKEGARRCRYVLKCDVRKYFPSVDHAILRCLLARAVKCPPTLDLAARIIDASNAQESLGQPDFPVFRQCLPRSAGPVRQSP
ncbi:MAG: reverse transcriptase domain-containing protein, partial [Bryobacteraceae bacterium]